MALRSQRDALSNISIDQVPLVGVDLNNIVFRQEKNETKALGVLDSLLAVGVQTYAMDLKLGRDGNLTLSGSEVTFQSVLSTIKRYLSSTNDYLNANMIVLLLSSALSSNSSTALRSYPNVTSLLENYLGLSTIYSPGQLSNDRSSGDVQNYRGQYEVSGWPSLNHFLYSVQRRVVISYINADSEEILSSGLIFSADSLSFDLGNSSVSCPLTDTTALTKRSNMSWRFLQSSFESNDIRAYVMCGYSPIINNSYTSNTIQSISSLLEDSLSWSWASNEPNTTTATQSNSTTLIARRCAVINYIESNSSSYWAVSNCYDRKRALCRHNDDEFEWVISEESANYFSAHEQGEGDFCPKNYTLSLPQTALQQKSVENYLHQLGSSDLEVWIDLNSVSVPDCWVAGGPYASCPYQKDVSGRNFVAMVTPVSVFSIFTIVILIFLSWRKVPIQHNRKRWKRLINSHPSSRAEGVPS